MDQGDLGMDTRSDSSSESSASSDESFEPLIQGCRHGRFLTVAASLIELTKMRRKEFLTKRFYDEKDQIYTPFLLSIRRGHVTLVKLFLTMFSINPNDECHVGNLTFDNYMVEGATPLWCAAATSNFDLVSLLFDHDANINQCTKTNSSPLRAACFCGNLKIVQFLIEKGANIETANVHLNTCVMVASYRGHLEVVEYLLDKGANPDVQVISFCACGNVENIFVGFQSGMHHAKDMKNGQDAALTFIFYPDSSGCTALHFAVEGSQLDIVKELVSKGCDINIVNENGLSPPYSAADACNSEMVEFFCSLNSVPPLQRITLLELLGASHANDKDRYDAGKTYHYFYLAIVMREHENLPKTILTPIEAYMKRKECETRNEVFAMQGDLDALHLESLIVRERILGCDNVEIPHPIVYRGAVYADGLQFARGLSLWQRALDLKQRNNREVVADIYRFAEVFSQMLVLREEIDVDALVKVLESCLLEATRTRDELETVKKTGDDRDIVISARANKCPHHKVTREVTIDVLAQTLEGIIHAMLYLILVVTKSAKMKSDLFKCGKVIYQFVKLDFRDRTGRTPLHMVLDEATPVDDFHVKDICCFPNSDMCRLLLNCGADPNAVCNDGNTPLHLIVQYAKPISDFVTLHQALTDLLEAGAHPDTRNRERKSPIDLATTGVAEIILRKESTWSLKCFAARTIRQYDIPYVGAVPVSLEKFIEKH